MVIVDGVRSGRQEADRRDLRAERGVELGIYLLLLLRISKVTGKGC